MEEDNMDTDAPSTADKDRIVYGEVGPSSGPAGLQAGVEKGNIQMQSSAETLQLPESSSRARADQEEQLRQFELRRRMRATQTPTDVEDVKRVLRRMGEPATLFGERKENRRERLQKLLALRPEEEQDALLAREGELAMAIAQEAISMKEKFYTEGPVELRQARLEIAYHSLERAALRLAAAKRRKMNPDDDEAAEREETAAGIATIVNQSSEIGDERPLAACAFSPDGARLATGAWSGLVKVWHAANMSKKLTIRASDERITGVAWHPQEGSMGEEGGVALATGAADCSLKLWSAAGKLVRQLTGHTQRLGRVAFHPSGKYVGSASFDGTWRLWDVSSGACLVEQEGHSRSVYALAFHPDGSLAASGGLDAFGRLWDLRTGRSVMVLQGHVKGILSLDFSANGYSLASGSEDHTARIWDLRRQRCAYTIPAHQSLVCQVRFEPNDGYYLLTAGYDNLAKLWSSKDYSLLKPLAGHEGKIMAADVSPDGSHTIATVGHDKTIKTWSPDTM